MAVSLDKQDQRLLPLQGGRNFRDLGGYPAADERRVRWGRLYRSGAMHRLTDADYQHLGRLGIKVICDFRSTRERTEAPTQWRATPAAEYVFRDYENASESLSSLSSLGSAVTGDMVRAMMKGFYAQMPMIFRDAYRELFARLLKGQVPLVFNCSAGKDRTGVAAALILSALGVPRAAILQDYALSETFVDYMGELGAEDTSAGDHGHDRSSLSHYLKLPKSALQALMRSDPDYIDTTLSHLDKEHGSVLAFLDTAFGVGASEVEHLRALLLEA